MSAICIATIFTLSSQSQATTCGKAINQCALRSCPTEWEKIQTPAISVDSCKNATTNDIFEAAAAGGRWARSSDQCAKAYTGTDGSDCSQYTGACGGYKVKSHEDCPKSHGPIE